MLQSLFYTVASAMSIYSLLCLVRIVLTWLPSANYSPLGRILASICDPYINWFRRFSFARAAQIDFTPILALGFLSLVSQVFMTLAATGRISLGIVLSGLLQVLWSFASFLLNIFILFLIIRLVYEFANPYGYSPFRTMLDRFLNPAISRVTKTFFKRQVVSCRVSVAITLAAFVVARVFLQYGVVILARLLVDLPI